MKNFTLRFYLSLSMALFLISGIVNAQTDKKAAEIKKAETGLATAKKNVAKNEKALAVADSLIAKGTELMNESKTEAKAIATERKALDKEYAAKQKALAKATASKDKAEATQAKADLKALDTKYKADSKALDNRLKAATTKATTGDANISKGKTGKKTAGDGLKTAQAALDMAQAKYNDVTGVTPPEEGKKKKK
jgi:chromosome segregation ATPase